MTLVLAICSAIGFALFIALGLRVSNRPLFALDAQAVWLRGHFTPLAMLLTISGRAPAMTAACAIGIAIFAGLRLPISLAMLMALSQLLSQMLIEYFKTLFRRVRPDYWLVGLEAGHSYPSGHAGTAVVFYLGWGLVVVLSSLPAEAKTMLAASLALWAIGVMWSRLALGAHYLTDVCGGALFGAAWLCALLALFAHVFTILR